MLRVSASQTELVGCPVTAELFLRRNTFFGIDRPRSEVLVS